MPSRLAAPTLVGAVRAIADDCERGFVFVKPDSTEKLYTFHDLAAEAERRAGQLVARGLRKGDRVALVIPDGDEFVLSFLGNAVRRWRSCADVIRKSVSRTSRVITTPSRTSCRLPTLRCC